MATGNVTQDDANVNSMPPTIDRLKRDHGFHRAAQLLADAQRCRDGLSPRPLSQLDPADREWFKQAARHAIEVFELINQPDREPDAEREKREAEERRLAQALESRLAIERSRGRLLATERGHNLTPWGPDGRGLDGDEQAYCTRCTRLAYISIGSDPVLSGTALTEGCLTSAPEGDPRR